MTKHYLYVKTDPLHYSLVGEFDSFDAAKTAKDNTYPDKKFRILTEQAALAEGKKQAQRTEKLTRTKEAISSGLEKVGRAGVKVAVRGGIATGRALKRGAERAAELHREKIKAEEEFERELYPQRVESEKAYRAQLAEEERERRSLEFQRRQELRKMDIEQELKARREYQEKPRTDVGRNISETSEGFFQQQRRIQRPIHEYQSGPGYTPKSYEPSGYDIGQPGQFKMPVYHTPMTSVFGGAEPIRQKKKKKKR